MADSTIDSNLLLLVDNWPGVPDVWCPPLDGFDDATSNNVASASAAGYRIGQKIQVYNVGKTSLGNKAGFSTFIFLQVGTQNADAVIACSMCCVPDSATVWYQVTNDPDDCVSYNGPLAAVALDAMTNAYYGWFWCGGVCPEEYVSGLGGTHVTVGDVAAGAMSTGNADDADVTAFGVAVTLKGICGYALATDT